MGHVVAADLKHCVYILSGCGHICRCSGTRKGTSAPVGSESTPNPHDA